MLLRLPIGPEKHQPAVPEQRKPRTQDRRVHPLADAVVGKQDILAGRPVVEREEEILAVGGGHPALEAHVEDPVVEGLHLAALQQVAVGEDDAVVVGQQDAGIADGVQPRHGARLLVEHKVARRVLAIRDDAQEDQRTHAGILDVGIIERLVPLGDRLGIDAVPGLGVVLDLDGQVAAHRFHKHPVLDRDVRMQAGAVHAPVGPPPVELVLARIDILVVEAVAQILEPAAGHPPLEDLDVLQALAGPHRDEQVRADHHELLEDRVAVILVEFREVRDEAGVVQHLGHRDLAEGPGGGVEIIGREDILDVGRLLQSELDVVAEQEAVPAHGDQVAGHAVVLGGDPLGPQQGGLHPAEHRQSVGVQPLEALAQGPAVLLQPGTDHLISPAFERFRSGLGFGHRRMDHNSQLPCVPCIPWLPLRLSGHPRPSRPPCRSGRRRRGRSAACGGSHRSNPRAACRESHSP